VVRALLGIVLLFAAVLKGYEPAAGSWPWNVPFFPHWLSIAFVELEFALGLWLLIGLYAEVTRRLAILFFSILAGVAFFKILSGESSCGCFGRIDITPRAVLAFDLAAVVALLRGRAILQPVATIRTSPTRAILFGTLVLWVGVPWAIKAGQSNFAAEHVLLEPTNWVGTCLPLLKHIDIGDRLARGRWALILYRHDCRACREALPKYERLARKLAKRPSPEQVALIEMPPYASPGEELVAPDSSCVLGRLDRTKIWSIATPAEISIRDCIVMPPTGATSSPSRVAWDD
jgi:hypothetical protein